MLFTFSSPRSTALLFFIAAAFLLSSPTNPLFGDVDFITPEESEFLTDDGTVALVWQESADGDMEGREYEVRRWILGEKGEGTLVYRGEDTATFLSGLNEGTYELKVRSRVGEEPYPDWSDTQLTVTVDYIDMGTVWVLMGAGFLTFLALLASIVTGSLRTRTDKEG